MIYEPTPEKADCFCKALNALPDSISTVDLLTFFHGCIAAYQMDESQRTTIALGLTMQGEIVDEDEDEDEEATLEFDDPKLAAMFKSGTA